MDKEYEVTEEIKELFETARAAEKCLKSAIKLIFSTKACIKYAKVKNKTSDEAWGLIYKMYPEIIGKDLTYSHSTKKVTVKAD